MADVSVLNAKIDELVTETGVAEQELKEFSEEVAQLSTNQAPSQEQIDAITAKAAGALDALKAADTANKPAPPAETPVPAPAGPPAGTETPAPAPQPETPAEAPAAPPEPQGAANPPTP